MENAIIMASGLGTRMRPLTNTVPKPLIQVAGKPMIETVIEGLIRRNIAQIVVVVGYLKEQFKYLEKKYSIVKLINNKDFETVNNISSIYYAKDILLKGACFICEADLFISDPAIFDADLKESCYFGRMVSGFSDDWVFEQDENGRISRVGKGGMDCYNMTGVSYFTSKDASALAKMIEKSYGVLGYEVKFWDDVVNENLDLLRLKIHPIEDGQIVEIDTVEELNDVNKQYGNNEVFI